MISTLSKDELGAAAILTDAIITGLDKIEINHNHNPDKMTHKREFVIGLLVAYAEDVKAK